MQLVQDELEETPLAVPGGHAVQVLAPAAEKEPEGQAEQYTEPAMEDVPAVQTVQFEESVAPLISEAVPAGQVGQVNEPKAAEPFEDQVPGGHGLQERPPGKEYLPAPHCAATLVARSTRPAAMMAIGRATPRGPLPGRRSAKAVAISRGG